MLTLPKRFYAVLLMAGVPFPLSSCNAELSTEATTAEVFNGVPTSNPFVASLSIVWHQDAMPDYPNGGRPGVEHQDICSAVVIEDGCLLTNAHCMGPPGSPPMLTFLRTHSFANLDNYIARGIGAGQPAPSRAAQAERALLAEESFAPILHGRAHPNYDPARGSRHDLALFYFGPKSFVYVPPAGERAAGVDPLVLPNGGILREKDAMVDFGYGTVPINYNPVDIGTVLELIGYGKRNVPHDLPGPFQRSEASGIERTGFVQLIDYIVEGTKSLSFELGQPFLPQGSNKGDSGGALLNGGTLFAVNGGGNSSSQGPRSSVGNVLNHPLNFSFLEDQTFALDIGANRPAVCRPKPTLLFGPGSIIGIVEDDEKLESVRLDLDAGTVIANNTDPEINEYVPVTKTCGVGAGPASCIFVGEYSDRSPLGPPVIEMELEAIPPPETKTTRYEFDRWAAPLRRDCICVASGQAGNAVCRFSNTDIRDILPRTLYPPFANRCYALFKAIEKEPTGNCKRGKLNCEIER